MDSTKLPIEIWIKILKFLSPETLLRFACVSKDLSLIASNNQLWWNHCWNHVSKYLFIMPVPEKESNESYKEYFLKIKKFCYTDSVDWNGYNFNKLKVGKETWERIDDLDFKKMVFELRYAFPSYAIESCCDSQIECYLNTIVCYKRNNGDLEKFLKNAKLKESTQENLFDIAYDPYARYKPDMDDELGEPMSSASRYKKLTFLQFVDEFKGIAPSANEMQMSDDSYDNIAIFVANFAINKFLEPYLKTFLAREASAFSSFYPRFAKFFFMVLTEMKLKHDDSEPLEAGQNINFAAITSSEYKTANLPALVKDKRMAYGFDSSNAFLGFNYEGMYLTPAKDFLHELLHIAIDNFIKFDFILDKTSIQNELRSKIDDFIAEFLNLYLDADVGDIEYYGGNELDKNESLMMLCSSFCIQNFQTISRPIMERICKLLFDVEIKDFFGLSKQMAREVQNEIRFIQLTDMENDHEAECVKLFASENYAVIVYDHFNHC